MNQKLDIYWFVKETDQHVKKTCLKRVFRYTYQKTRIFVVFDTEWCYMVRKKHVLRTSIKAHVPRNMWQFNWGTDW